jgi:hypothetical protein
MKLTLARTNQTCSLQRRLLLTEAEPVHARLNPDRILVPADLRIWWQAQDGEPAGEDTLHANAWPAERETTLFADWRDELAMPAWVRELSEVVHADLLANAASPNSGAEDRWAHTLKRKYTVDGADIIPASRYNREAFVPADFDIWWSLNVGLPKCENRYSIYAHSAGRDRKTAHLGGSRSSFEYSDDELPDWIRDLADAQYLELEAAAQAATAERESRA